MPAWDVLSGKWPLVLALLTAFGAGLIAAQILYFTARDFARDVLDRLEARRKPVVKLLYTLLHQRMGTAKAIAFIFVVNVLGASLFQHTLGGLLILPPFGFLFMGGLLIGLIVRKYPERLWTTVIVSPFEFGAFVAAATGGVNMGLSIWVGDVGLAVREWGILFLTLVVPLQFLNALLEGMLAARAARAERESWPEGLLDERA